MICYDIGANIGTSSMAMSLHNEGATVYAFEPVSGTREILNRNLDYNSIDNVVVQPFGLGAENSTSKILVTPGMLANAHQISGEIPKSDAWFTEDIDIRRLDDWRTETGAPRPDFIKIDVEGFEVDVIAGGRDTFFENPDLVVIIEFAIKPQRAAAEGVFPRNLKDRHLFDILTSHFAHIFLIERTGRLTTVHSYSQLRALMLRGYPVEDLLVCHRVTGDLAVLINEASTIPGWLLDSMLTGPRETVAVIGRWEDGWARGSNHLEPSSALCVHATDSSVLRLRFPPVFAQHADAPLGMVLVVSDREAFAVDPADREVCIDLRLQTGVNWILVEATHSFSASRYFQNPEDTRRLAFRYFIGDLEPSHE